MLAQLQGQVAATVDEGFAAKGPLPCIWYGMICGTKATQPLSDFPKLGPGRICIKILWCSRNPYLHVCIEDGFCALSLTSLHFLFSLCSTKRALCDPLGAGSYGALTAAAGTASWPTVWFCKKKNLQGSHGEGMDAPAVQVCLCRGCARVGVVLTTHSLEVNSTFYAMMDEALSTGCALLDGKGVTATWI